MICIKGMACQRASERLTYSALVVENSISVANHEAHAMGQSAKQITKPIRDIAVAGLLAAVSRFHLPAKDVSAYTLKAGDEDGL